ncbi:YnfA family protein [Paenochrobactrum glaciei]|uniref:YnfA family protein n=1 Tax=Paenochrobactrum glaciei TaxID=486407 RepID=A0ABN1GLP3_9HYPH
MPVFNALSLYILAALAEIAGCYAFWAWLRLHKSPLWIIPGVVSLVFFAWLLTHIDLDFAGRAYAAYGGIYIIASIFWLWVVEQQMPSRWDIIGGLLCLGGMMTILLGQLSKI